MRTKKQQKMSTLWISTLAVLVIIAWIAVAGSGRLGQGALNFGGPRLISIQPLPEMSQDGSMCEWMPASAGQELVAAVMQSQAPSSSSADADVRNGIVDRPPLRVIKDPYPTYSAVAIDMANREIVLQDENLFQIMTYDRTTDTPASAGFSEPKRIIGGHHTKVEFNCGLYVDPKTGDIYSVNNDTIDTLVIFDRDARGDVPPTRELSTPHRTYGIAVDEEAEEMFLTVQDSPQVVVYNKYAEGEDEPIRVLRGNKTLMADAHGIALDTQNGWMFVANYGNATDYSEEGFGSVPGSGRFLPPSITVYPIKSEGDVAPIRVITGPKTQMNWPAHIFLDEERGELFVANDGGHSVLVFKATDNGDVAPTRVIEGPKTQLRNPTGVFVDTENDEIVVANMGNHRATVYPRSANGDVAPSRVIRSAPADQPALQIGNPGAVAYDTMRNEILVPN